MMFKKPTFTRRRNRTKHAMKQYRVARKRYLAVHPWCEVGEVCTEEHPDPWGEARVYPGRATEVHHVRGRGVDYLNQDRWLAVCQGCHAYIHQHPSWSYEHGYMERRNESNAMELSDGQD